MALQLEERRALSNGVQTEQRRKHVIHFFDVVLSGSKKRHKGSSRAEIRS